MPIHWTREAKLKTGKLFAYGLLLLGLIWFMRNPNAAAEVESKRATYSVANKNTTVKAFMRKKLIAGDQILEGLSTPDMKLVQKGATCRTGIVLGEASSRP